MRKWFQNPMLPATIAVLILLCDTVTVKKSLTALVSPAAWGTSSLPDVDTNAQITRDTFRFVASTPEPPITAAPIEDLSHAAPPGPWEIIIDPRDLFPAGAPIRERVQMSPDPLPPLVAHSPYLPYQAAPLPTEVPPAYEDSMPVDPHAYRIRSGDVLDVFVWGQDNLNTRTRVARDGTIVVKLAGSIRMSGLTVDQASATIAGKLRRYLIQPAVTVTVAEPGGKDVTVVGEVEAPGPFTIDRPTRLLDLLVQAKWSKDRADLSDVTVSRGDSKITCDIASVLKGQRIEENIYVEPGDLVIIPSREQVVNLLGAFTKPGKYVFPMNRALRVRDLLLESSTWGAKAHISKAFILRADGSIEPCNLNALWFQGDAREDKVLRNGDSIIIPEITDIGVFVLGQVGSPGLHTRQGSFTLLQALTMANISSANARTYDVRVVRGWPDNPKVYKVSIKSLLDGDLTQNMMLENGDVVFVPQGILSYTLSFWNQLLAPLNGTASTVVEVGTVGDDLKSSDQ